MRSYFFNNRIINHSYSILLSIDFNDPVPTSYRLNGIRIILHSLQSAHSLEDGRPSVSNTRLENSFSRSSSKIEIRIEKSRSGARLQLNKIIFSYSYVFAYGIRLFWPLLIPAQTHAETISWLLGNPLQESTFYQDYIVPQHILALQPVYTI